MTNELEKLEQQLFLVNIRLRNVEDDMNLKAKEGERFYRRGEELSKKIKELKELKE